MKIKLNILNNYHVIQADYFDLEVCLYGDFGISCTQENYSLNNVSASSVMLKYSTDLNFKQTFFYLVTCINIKSH